MQLVAIVLAGIALPVSVLAAFAAWRQLRLARHANALPVLVDMFREHRSDRLAEVRRFVYHDLGSHDLSRGLAALPEDKQATVRELAWFYDNLGALVVHNIVDIELVSGYLGTSVVMAWERLQPLVVVERQVRAQATTDPLRWQRYFENLATLVQEVDPEKARARSKHWRL
jgi:hypothetical protein